MQQPPTYSRQRASRTPLQPVHLDMDKAPYKMATASGKAADGTGRRRPFRPLAAPKEPRCQQS
jgi:hypothetical protein